MTYRAYAFITATVFFFVALLHLARLVWGSIITVNGWTIPYWISISGLIAAATLSVWGYRTALRHSG